MTNEALEISWNKRQEFRVSVLLGEGISAHVKEFVVKDDGWQIRVENAETGNLISAISTPVMRGENGWVERMPYYLTTTIIVGDFLREHFKR